MRQIYVLFSFVLAILFAGCAGGSIKPEVMAKHMRVLTPKIDNQKVPVVFFFQGSGGTNNSANRWSTFFFKHGVASIMIDNAKVRGYKKLYGANYEADLSSALAVLSMDPNNNLDLTRYAVMGFSRGGTMAMKSDYFLKEGQPKPDLIFALYPGDTKGCPNSHGDKTDVHIFYGELDDWGGYKGIRNTCKGTASYDDKVSFHLLKDAHHSYDGRDYEKWTCCGGRTFTSEPNYEALYETKKIIKEAMVMKWNVKELNILGKK